MSSSEKVSADQTPLEGDRPNYAPSDEELKSFIDAIVTAHRDRLLNVGFTPDHWQAVGVDARLKLEIAP